MLNLTQALKILAPIIPEKPRQPLLSNVLLNGDKIIASDLDNYAIAHQNLYLDQSLCISYDLLFQIINKLVDKETRFQVFDEERLTFNICYDVSFKYQGEINLFGQHNEEFPCFNLPEETPISLKFTSEILQSITTAEKFSGKETYARTYGVNLVTTNDALYVRATNGSVAYLRKFQGTYAEKSSFTLKQPR